MSRAYRPFDGDAWLGRDIALIGGPYRIVPESAFAVAEEMAYARQGRKARVYKLRGPSGAPYALKTFYRGFGLAEYAQLTRALLAFGDIQGLRACQRRLIDEVEAGAVGEPGLTYAVLMPWIEGVSWAGVVEGRFPLPAETGAALAAKTATVLAEIEDRGLTHADISSSNIFVTSTDLGAAIELIDVEDMFHESLGELPYVPDGSPGYAHPRNQGRGCRNRFGDRFAGAILLTEMLVWHHPAVRRGAADVSVFEPDELGHGGPKYDLVLRALRSVSIDAARLLERVWDSPGPSGCPKLSEWAAAIAQITPGAADTDIDLNHLTSIVESVAHCPGCGHAAGRVAAEPDHANTCPLRRPAAQSPVVAATTNFRQVPMNASIGFIPLYGPDD